MFRLRPDNLAHNKRRLTLLQKGLLMQKERDMKITPAEIAARWGCSVVAVNQALSVADSPQEIQNAIHLNLLTGSDAVLMKKLTPENQIKIAKAAQEARDKNQSFGSSQVREMARDLARSQEEPTKDEKRKPGRPAVKTKLVSRSVAVLRKAIKPCEGVVPNTLRLYMEGDLDMDDHVLVAILRCVDDIIDMNDERVVAAMTKHGLHDLFRELKSPVR